MSFNRKAILTTALGVCEPFAYLTKPDYGNEERGFGNPRGVYKVNLTIDNKNPRCQSMIDEIVKAHEEHFAQRKAEYEENPPQVQRGKKPLLPYEGDLPFIDNGDGTTTFKFSCYASYQDKKTKETKAINVTIVDSKGKRIEDLPAFIGGGSKLKLKYSLMPYTWNPTVGASVKLQLSSVMLVELAAGGAGGGDDWSDDAEEGGYEAQQSQGQRDEQSWQQGGESDGEADSDDDF